MPRKQHWENIYSTKSPDGVSWYQTVPEASLRLILGTGIGLQAPIIDVGGGASTLIDGLLEAGFSDLSVLDLSGTALDLAKSRLGDLASQVQWIESDVRCAELPPGRYEVWHDRAVFHFLTDPEDRRSYVRTLLTAVRPGGHMVLSTFASDGPERCSGLPVVRYDPAALHAEFGDPFELIHHEREDHQTPTGGIQRFLYCYCLRR